MCIASLYEISAHELDAVLAQAGLQIAVTRFTPEPAERGASFAPFKDSAPAGEGDPMEHVA